MKDELQNNILPDEEDLTLVENLIKFKNRIKDPNKHTGRGYKILRLCNPESPTGNILQQSDMMDTNTIYEIRYDFDLNQQTIVIPINSILYINGGSLSNGKLTGNDTIIINYNILNFDKIQFQGTFKIDSLFLSTTEEEEVLKYKNLKGEEHLIYNIFNIASCYKESANKPEKPKGGRIDQTTNKLVTPYRWSSSPTNMTGKIWISSGRFNESGKLIGEWSDPTIFMNPKPIFRWEGSRSECKPSQIGKIQISEDGGESWEDLSQPFINYLRILDYASSVEQLPTDAILGAIYMVGPNYDESDINHENPTYRMYVNTDRGWINNGIYNGLTIGVAQDRGDSETEVMSQKVVTQEIEKLEQAVNTIENSVQIMSVEEYEELPNKEENVFYYLYEE